MEDKTPLYMVIIVGIVALVGLILMVAAGPSTTQSSSAPSVGLTGNVVANTGTAVDLNVVGKIFFTVFLVGIAGFMYFRDD